MFKLCIIKARSTWVCWRTGIWRFQCAFMSYGGQCTYRKTDVLFSLFWILVRDKSTLLVVYISTGTTWLYSRLYILSTRRIARWNVQYCSIRGDMSSLKCNTINHSHGFTKFKRNFKLFIHTFSKNAVSLMLNSICLILNIWLQTLHYFIFFKCQ